MVINTGSGVLERFSKAWPKEMLRDINRWNCSAGEQQMVKETNRRLPGYRNYDNMIKRIGSLRCPQSIIFLVRHLDMCERQPGGLSHSHSLKYTKSRCEGALC